MCCLVNDHCLTDLCWKTAVSPTDMHVTGVFPRPLGLSGPTNGVAACSLHIMTQIWSLYLDFLVKRHVLSSHVKFIKV